MNIERMIELSSGLTDYFRSQEISVEEGMELMACLIVCNVSLQSDEDPIKTKKRLKEIFKFMTELSTIKEQ